MTNNIAQTDLVAVEIQIDRDEDLYYHGEFDGATGGKPEQELWSNLSYRSGWLAGVAKYYDKKFNNSIGHGGETPPTLSFNFTTDII